MVAGGAAYGRRAIDVRIREEVDTEIEAAKSAAIAELEREMSSVLAIKLYNFGIHLAIKAGFVGGAYLLHSFGHLSADGLRLAIGALIFVFILRDGLAAAPFALPAWRVARRWGWNLSAALRDYVAGIAFERAYSAVFEKIERGPNRRWIALSNYTTHSISTEAALAIAEVARTAPYGRVKARAALGAGLAVVMLIAYWAFFWVAANPI